MEWGELARKAPSWVTAAGEEAAVEAPDQVPSPPFVTLTRLLSYRNFAGEPFPISASREACLALADRAVAFIQGSRDDGSAVGDAEAGWGDALRLADCGPDVLRMLRERHLIAEPALALPGKKGVRFLIPGRPGHEEKRWAWINEGEHLVQVQAFAGRLPSGSFPENYQQPREDRSRPWAFSPRLGFLTSNPVRLGPALCVQMLIHLPALALARRLAQAHGSMSALGMGFSQAGSGAPGSRESAMFWVSSRGGLGKTPEEVYRAFTADVQPLLDWESSTQAALFGKHRKRLEDRVHQSLELLREARVLAYADLAALGSWARLGAYAGILDPQIPTLLEELRIIAQSGHLTVSHGRAVTKEEEDIQRANVVRLTLKTT